MRARWLAIVAVVCTGCGPALSPDQVRQIQVCSTRYDEVKESFGDRYELGRSGAGLITWTYRGRGDRNAPAYLIVAYDERSVVVDYAYNVPGHVELANRCAPLASPKDQSASTRSPAAEPKAQANAAPKGAAGFVFGSTEDDAKKACEGAKQTWSSAGSELTCSGPAVPTGAGGTVSLRFCDAKLCRIAITAQPSDWVRAQSSLQKTLEEKYGTPADHATSVPPECRQTVVDCIRDGRAKLSSTWTFDKGSSIVLFSGVPDGETAAVLRLVYERVGTKRGVAADGL